MASHFKIAQPVEYYRKFLEKDTRPDGRGLDEFRETVLNVGSITTADGSSCVRLGNTNIICGIKAEVAPPTSDEPKTGFIVPNVDLSPLCSAQFKQGPPSERAQATCQFMHDLIKTSVCVKLEDLCISEGKMCWVLYCDMMCLDYDGNLLDACTLALSAALSNVRLPVASINDVTGQLEIDFSKSVALKVNSRPISTTFAIFDDKCIFVDPTREEEDLVTGVLTIVTLDDGKLCMVVKPGGSGMTEIQLQDCVTDAHRHTPEMCSLIDGAVRSFTR